MTNFRTLAHGLREASAGARITHALFTTFAFETNFFEANIVPLLLESTDAMSSHEGVRRLQLNEKLCLMPDSLRPEIEVFVDANAADRAVPWLPYQLHAVQMSGAFHGKVILLRLERGKDGNVRTEWVLGCGSANLTLAGWWENIETWHFTAPFSANAVPADIFPDLNRMLDWLREVSPNRPHGVLDAWRAESPAASRKVAGQRFIALLDFARDRFTNRLRDLYSAAIADNALEVVSPFFCKDDHGTFAEAVRASLGCSALRIWLPIDVWNDGAGLLTQAQFGALRGSATVRWAALARKSELFERATPASLVNRTPRKTHAKVLRVPGVFTFIGSVNFSRAAFDRNFEAGFLFADSDTDRDWLEPSGRVPCMFVLDQPAPGESAPEPAGGPVYDATFDWKTSELTVLPPKQPDPFYAQAALSWRDPRARTVHAIRLGEPLTDRALAALFGTQPVIDIDWQIDASTRGAVALWVHQESLNWRPIPPELELDVWSMIDLWRSTQGARIGGDDSAWQRILERIELQQNVTPDAPANAPLRDDLFERMTHIHGAFQQLREQMRPRETNAAVAPDQGDLARYYLCTERADSFKTMLTRMKQQGGIEEFDEIESWVVLHWIKLIAGEHAGSGEDVGRCANELIDALRAGPLRDLPQDKLDWLSAAFLGDPEAAVSVTNNTETECDEVTA